MIKFSCVLISVFLACCGCSNSGVDYSQVSYVDQNSNMAEYKRDTIREIDRHVSGAFDEAIKEYVENYMEEAAFDKMFTPFTYPTNITGESMDLDTSLRPLHNVLVEVTKTKRPIFSPVVVVTTFHYPKEIKIVSTEEKRGMLEFIGILPEDQIKKSCATHSVFRVFRRDNNTKEPVINAQSIILVALYSPSHKEPNMVWLYSEFKWNPKTKEWLGIKARKLGWGENPF